MSLAITEYRENIAFNSIAIYSNTLDTLISQYILGISADFDGLKIDPSIPAAWDGLNATRQFRGATYDIKVTNPDHVNKGIKSVTVDGNAIEWTYIP